MSMTLTYDGGLARVRLAATGLAVTTPVTVQRSTDQVTWTTVRGGASIIPAGGSMALDDYEFTPDVPNHYRLIGPSRWDTFSRTVAGAWGTADSGQAWSVGGGTGPDFSVSGGVGRQSHGVTNAYRRMLLPGTYTDAEVVRDAATPVLLTGAALVTGTVLRYTNASNYYWLRCEFIAGSTAIMAKISKRVAGVETSLAVVDGVPGLSYAAGVPLRTRARVVGSRLYLRIWPADATEPQAWTLTATDTALTAAGQVGEQTWLVGGNTNTLPVAASVDNWAQTLPAATLGSSTVTPVLDGVWLKSIARPFLNRRVTVLDYSDIERPARTGVFEVIGRTLPVSVSDVRGSRRWTMQVLTQTPSAAEDFDLVLASGDPMLVHVPADCDVPGGYVAIGDTAQQRTARRSPRRRFVLPLTEVAAPGPDVVGATSNWQSVLNTYPTWQDVLNANPTWQDLLEVIGSAADVVVP